MKVIDPKSAGRMTMYVKDEGAPDTRTAQFRPGIKPGIHLGRLSRYYLF